MSTSSSSSNPLALVTGCSGYLAGHIVKQLLERGFRVRGTVRNLKNEEKVAHLKELFPQLELFEADLLNEKSFDEAVKGCDYVFHTASPFILSFNDPQKDLVDPALKGTLNVLKSVDASGSVKRVVITSSGAAVCGKREEGHIYTEDDWNLDSTLDFETYRYSKRIAEQSAWEFSKGKKWDLVVINPCFIMGPPLSKRTDAVSVNTVKKFLDGSLKEKGAGGGNAFGCCDVRDVAKAHIEGALHGKGRYLVSSSKGFSHLELVEMLRKSKKFDNYPLPTSQASPTTYRFLYDNSKVQKELGVTLRPLEETVVDMADELIRLGIVPKQ